MAGGSGRVAGGGLSSNSGGRWQGGVNDNLLLAVAVVLEKRRWLTGGSALAAWSTFCVKNSAPQKCSTKGHCIVAPGSTFFAPGGTFFCFGELLVWIILQVYTTHHLPAQIWIFRLTCQIESRGISTIFCLGVTRVWAGSKKLALVLFW